MHRLLNTLLAFLLVGTTVSADSRRVHDLAHPRASAPALPFGDGQDLPASALPKTTPSVDWLGSWLTLGTTRYEVQSTGSLSRMIAVSSDGMVHGAYSGGINASNGRRVMAWCVDPFDSSVIGPATVENVASNHIFSAVSGSNPTGDMQANTGILAFHTQNPARSGMGMDFDGCTLAFVVTPHPEAAALWPRVAVDGADRIHMIAHSAAGSDSSISVLYDTSQDGSHWDDNSYQLVTDQATCLGSVAVGNTHSNRAALLFLEKTGPEDVPYDGTWESPEIGRQLHNDLVAYVANDGDLSGEIQAENRINITAYGPDSDAPFGTYGCRAYSDADGLFDMTAEENLHAAFSTCVMFTDTLTVHDGNGLPNSFVYYNWNLGRGQIWHTNLDTGEWSHVAGYSSAITDAEHVIARPQAWRMFIDRPTMALDPATGFLYTVWSGYSRADTSAAGYHNGEIMARCSADNGLTWGPAVNLSDTQSPGGECGACEAEDWPCVAALADGGYLHLTFVHDRDAGGATLGEGCETINNVIYQKVPVDLVPPHSGEPWDAPGHVGLVSDRRWFSWECGAWAGDDAYLDSTLWVEPIHVFNESPHDVHVLNIGFYHHPSDLLGTPEDGGLTQLDLEIFQDGSWQPLSQWNGWLPQWRATKFRAHVAYSGLPNFDQLLVFHLDGQPDLVYRVEYEALDEPLCTGVERLDRNTLDDYEALFLMDVGIADSSQPACFALEQNWPNPFNPTTTLAFTLDHAGFASLTVHNLLGETVATLVDGPVPAGRHTVDFDASALASGVYICTLEAGGRSESRKLVLMK